MFLAFRSSAAWFLITTAKSIQLFNMYQLDKNIQTVVCFYIDNHTKVTAGTFYTGLQLNNKIRAGIQEAD